MPKRDAQTDTQQPAAPDPVGGPIEPRPEPTPAAGGRYRRLPDGSLEPIADEE